MVVWITGIKKQKKEKSFAEAIAGAFVRGVALHGADLRKKFHIKNDEKAELILQYRIAIIAQILEEQGCLVVIAHWSPWMKTIRLLRKQFQQSLVVEMLDRMDESEPFSQDQPILQWVTSDRIHDRDESVEAVLSKLKELGCIKKS